MGEDDVSTVVPPGPPRDSQRATVAGDVAAGSRTARATPGRGEQIGNFVVQGHLGAGAMGVVLLALDAELDRKVAIKILTAGVEGPVAQARLVREARSAAGLQHPNVVTVFQVGTHHGQIYVVMEYVDGGTLRQFIEEQAPDWATTLELYRQAARGLAAAHAANLVHRDFKPDNVLIGRDGRVRVSDFGLVGLVGEPVAGATTVRDGPLDDRLTQTGTVMGTPAYMAPEQMAGADIDAHADQFAFCVALYEALWGTRPFSGDTLPNLVTALRRGADPPPRSEVPVWVHKAVLKGLCFAPEDRHDSMEALLASLQPPRPRTIALVAVGSVGLLAAGAITTGLLIGDDAAVIASPDTTCPDTALQLGAAWDPKTRSAVEEGFLASEHPRAAAVFAHLASRLDARAKQWIAASNDSCVEVRRDTGTAPARRAECLTAVRDELELFTQALRGADAAVVDGSLVALARVPGVDRCARTVPAPLLARPTPAQQAALAELPVAVRRLELVLAGERAAQAFEGVEPLIPQIRATGYSPLLARALLLRGAAGFMYGDTITLEEGLRDAMAVAASASAHAYEAEATATLMGVMMMDDASLSVADALLPGAEAAAQRSGDARVLAVVGMAAATLSAKHRDMDAALARDDVVIALLEAAKPGAADLAAAYEHRGVQRVGFGDLDDGLADLERAQTLVSDQLGQSHPTYGKMMLQTGAAYFFRREYQTAADVFARAALSLGGSIGRGARSTIAAVLQHGRALLHGGDIEAARKVYGDALQRCDMFRSCQGRLVTVILENLAWADLIGRHYDEAAAHYERALGEEGGVPLSAADRSRVERFAGYTDDAAGDHWGARAHFQRMRDAEIEAHGPKHEYVIWATNLAANSARHGGDCALAREDYRRALRLREDLAMTPGPYLAEAMLGLGECELSEGKIDAARESLKTAYDLRAQNIEPDIKAGILFAHARLLARDQRRAEAIALAQNARAMFADAGVPRDASVARVDAWLKAQAARK